MQSFTWSKYWVAVWIWMFLISNQINLPQSTLNLFARVNSHSKFIVQRINTSICSAHSKKHSKTFKMSCNCTCCPKKIVTHQICGPDVPYCGPALPVPTQYLYWSTRPIITYTSTDEVKKTWNLKRRTPNIPDIMCQEMYDKDGNRYFWGRQMIRRGNKIHKLLEHSTKSEFSSGGLCGHWTFRIECL